MLISRLHCRAVARLKSRLFRIVMLVAGLLTDI